MRNTERYNHFLQHSPLVQLYISASDCKYVRDIPGKHFMKAFSIFLVAFLITSLTSQKHRPFNADFTLGTVNNHAGPGQECMGNAAQCYLLRSP